MVTFMVPALEPKAERWPTLGDQVADWIEQSLVFGPGDLKGDPARLDAEKRALLGRMYEIHPRDHPLAGRRRFRRVAISLRKGTAKTEFAAWIAAAELHPDAPVRFGGWEGDRPATGRGVTDPYIPLVAYTEEQSDELAYAALLVVIGEGPLAAEFDIGLERILHRDGGGRAVSLASAPNARDGARTTFEVFDETHRWTLPRQRQAHQTMLANLPKRRLAEPWALEITTAPAIGEGSVAEGTLSYARQVAEGKVKDTRLFFFHRQASDAFNLDTATEAEVREAVIEASGPAAAWSDIDGIVEQFRDPQVDLAYLDRVWLNRPRAGGGKAFDVAQWDALAQADYQPAEGAAITVGFDGSRWNDATALVATEISTGYQWILGLWERPLDLLTVGPGQGQDGGPAEWEVPRAEVNAAVEETFRRYRVARMYCDPFEWQETIDNWAGQYGPKVVVEWRTNRLSQAAAAIKSYRDAIKAAEVCHGGDGDFRRHLGNAVTVATNFRDDAGERMTVIAKERKGSPRKIVVAMAAVLSWEARNDAIKDGALTVEGPSVYEERGMRVLGPDGAAMLGDEGAAAGPQDVERRARQIGGDLPCPSPRCDHLPGMHDFRGGPEAPQIYCYGCDRLCAVPAEEVLAVYAAWTAG